MHRSAHRQDWPCNNLVHRSGARRLVMAGRVEGKVAIVVGAGQTPGETIGNGRATAMLLAREGATVVVVDRELTTAQDTVDMIVAEGGEALALAAEATGESGIQGL